jgi:hypothetical protein
MLPTHTLVTKASQRARLRRHRSLALSRLCVPAMVYNSLLAGINNADAIRATWREAFPRIREKLHLPVAPTKPKDAIRSSLQALAMIGVLAIQPDERVKVLGSGRRLVARLADSFDLDRDVDRRVEIS